MTATEKEVNEYKSWSPDKLEELFSNFLIDSWSFSKVAAFARNEKNFEMQYIYGMTSRQSASSVSGSAYHCALQYYFSSKKDGIQQDIVNLQACLFNYIDDFEAHRWKLQKTTPNIEICKNKATETGNKLLKNFFSYISVYESDLEEILGVELRLDEFIVVNGVSIPLPCHSVIDLIIKTKDGKIVIIDHKSKTAFTDENEIKYMIGKQAITYILCYESATGQKVDEVWFIENKASENKDKSPQLSCCKVILDDDTRKLYQALLYEPLKRLLEALQDPDYIYLINDNDNFVDRAELYEFWSRTMIAEVGEFNVPDNKKELISKRLKKIKDSSMAVISPQAIRKFREGAAEFIQYDLTNKNMTKEEKIEHTLRTLGLVLKVAKTFSGYSSDTFLLEVSAGTTMSSIFKYKLDIANSLNVSNVRIQKDLFVYEGKSYIAVEASKKRESDLLFDKKYLVGFKIPLGIDNFGNVIYWDTENPSSPHILVCGSTGSGKSIFIMSVIEYAKLLNFNEIIIFDPKFEFLKYKSQKIKIHNSIEDIEEIMETQVKEMNELIKIGCTKKTLIIFDEFADAQSASKKGNALNIYHEVQVGTYKNGLPKYKRELKETKKSLEENLRILLQKGRSVGYRIISATQRASVSVIGGDSKVNFPVQICFKVPKDVDSQVVIGEAGSESLAGKGDGLIKSPEYSGVIRFQSFIKF